MATSRQPFLSRTGGLPVLICFVAAVVAVQMLGWLWSIPLWLITVLLAYLNRDPDRSIPSNPLAVVSPADGVVKNIAEVRDPYLVRDAILLEIEMSPLGVYSTRSPVEGKVLEPRHEQKDGVQRPHGVWLKTDEGDDLVMTMHRGLMNSMPRCYVGFGERVGQGQRCGSVYLGGKIDVYMPVNSRVQVSVGTRVSAGSDVIATLLHK